MAEQQKPEAQPVARVLAVAVDGTPLRDSRGVEWLTQVAPGTELYAEADLAALRAELFADIAARDEIIDRQRAQIHDINEDANESNAEAARLVTERDALRAEVEALRAERDAAVAAECERWQKACKAIANDLRNHDIVRLGAAKCLDAVRQDAPRG